MEEKSSLNLKPTTAAPKKEVIKANSKTSTDEIVGRIVESQPSLFKMLRTSIFAGTIENAKKYVYKQIIEPDMKALLFNVFVSFMSVWIFDDDRSKRANSASNVFRSTLGSSHTDYSAMAKNGGQNNKREANDPSEVKDIVFDTRDEARKVAADVMKAVEDNGGYISVYKYYELCHVKMQDMFYTQKSWGWVDLEEVSIYQNADGWHIDMPRPAVNLSRALEARNNRVRR